MNDQNFTLSRQEASEYTGISLRTLDRYIGSGKVSYKKIKGRVLFNPKDLDNLKIEKNLEHIENVNTDFDFNKKRIETQTKIINHEDLEEKDFFFKENFVPKAEYEKVVAEKETYKIVYEKTFEELKNKQSELQKISFDYGTLQSQKEIPLLEIKRKDEDLVKIQSEMENKDLFIGKLREEIGVQKSMKIFFMLLFILSLLGFVIFYFSRVMNF